MAQRSSDAAVAFLCCECHAYVDQGVGAGTFVLSRLDHWEEAHRATLRWLIESGHLVVSLTPQPPPDPPPKPKRGMAKSKRPIQSRGFDTGVKQKIPSRPFPKRAKP